MERVSTLHLMAICLMAICGSMSQKPVPVVVLDYAQDARSQDECNQKRRSVV